VAERADPFVGGHRETGNHEGNTGNRGKQAHQPVAHRWGFAGWCFDEWFAVFVHTRGTANRYIPEDAGRVHE
jgi:hypothetical protein